MRKVKSVGLRIGVLNVGTSACKVRELADMMQRRSIGAGFTLYYHVDKNEEISG